MFENVKCQTRVSNVYFHYINPKKQASSDNILVHVSNTSHAHNIQLPNEKIITSLNMQSAANMSKTIV